MTGRAASEGTRVGDVSDAAGGDGAGHLRLVESEPAACRRAVACDAADVDDRRAPGPSQDAGFGAAVGDAGAGGASGVTSTAVAAGDPGAAITGAGAGFGS